MPLRRSARATLTVIMDRGSEGVERGCEVGVTIVEDVGRGFEGLARGFDGFERGFDVFERGFEGFDRKFEVGEWGFEGGERGLEGCGCWLGVLECGFEGWGRGWWIRGHAGYLAKRRAGAGGMLVHDPVSAAGSSMRMTSMWSTTNRALLVAQTDNALPPNYLWGKT